MSDSLRKILALVILVVTVLGWILMVWGLGPISPLKDRIPLGLDIKGGVNVVLEATDTEATGEELRDLMEQTQTVISNRVDQMGIANATVRVEGNDRIRVELPGAENSEEAIAQVGKTAQLQFLLADGSIVLDGSNVNDASMGQNTETGQGGYLVNLEFDSEGAALFEEATKTASSGEVTSGIDGVADNAIIILLDDEIISAPVVEEVISGGQCVIEGDFTQDEATNLAALIRGGSLPVELTEVSSSVQSAEIGYDAFNMSVIAGVIGVIAIFIMMVVGYRIMGVAASLALLLYGFIILAIMAVFESVITLSGIAGIILSIGMAVDANIIIFTRIKEEISAGRTVRAATQVGFKRALSTIIDSQVTTLIAAVILYQIGTSAVKGFAFTLMIGIFASILTAVLITQLYLGVVANSRRFGTMKLFCMREDGKPAFTLNKVFHVLEHRKIYYCVSAGIIIIGLCFGLFRGFNWGIDFTGGTMMQINMGGNVTAEEVQRVLKEDGVKDATVIYGGENNEEVIIKTTEAFNNEERAAIIDDLQAEFNFSDEDVVASELFGPAVGKELRNNAIKAIILAAAGMLIYIRLRFANFKFGGAALAGVLHDVIMMLVFYLVFNVTVNNPFIAAILTVVGYSINDTIVVFDRVRENNRFMKKESDMEIVNISVSQTLSRTIMTSLTTFVVMVPVFIMGGESMREFTLPLMVGIFVGCLSSIFVCSPIYYDLTRIGAKSAYEKTVEAGKKKSRTSKKKYQGLPKKKKEPQTDEKAAIPVDVRQDRQAADETASDDRAPGNDVPAGGEDIEDILDAPELEIEENIEKSNMTQEEILEAAEREVAKTPVSGAKGHKKKTRAERRKNRSGK